MKKILFIFLFLSTSLFGVDGYKVYKKHCMSCHAESRESRNDFDKMKAPPMYVVFNRLNSNIHSKNEDEDVKRHLFILFVKDYIMNPNLDVALCNAFAIDNFGVMPSQKGIITEEEAEAVSIWLYDHYETEEL